MLSLGIPESITTITDGAFCGCTSITSVTIHSGVTAIGYNAFYDCTALTSIVIPESINCIEYGVFEGCSSLKEVTIPSSVTHFRRYAFGGCTALTEITIPEEFDKIFMGYNEIQKRQGLDLSRYKNKSVMRYTYEVTNYSGEDGKVYSYPLKKTFKPPDIFAIAKVVADYLDAETALYVRCTAESMENAEAEIGNVITKTSNNISI